MTNSVIVMAYYWLTQHGGLWQWLFTSEHEVVGSVPDHCSQIKVGNLWKGACVLKFRSTLKYPKLSVFISSL